MANKIATKVNEYGDGLASDVVLVVDGQRYGVGGVMKGHSGRKVYGGDLVPGPWHYVFGLASVIDNHGGTASEMERLEARGLVVRAQTGDEVEIDGLKYKLTKSFNGVHELKT